jgi:hypothetical protein
MSELYSVFFIKKLTNEDLPFSESATTVCPTATGHKAVTLSQPHQPDPS